MSDFAPGDLVVCVDARPDWIKRPPAILALERLQRGAIYRVRRLGQNHLGKIGIDIGVKNSDIFAGFNDVWPPKCFRKLNDEPDDIALIERIKACRPIREKAPA